jgi:hypothetical protein
MTGRWASGQKIRCYRLRQDDGGPCRRTPRAGSVANTSRVRRIHAPQVLPERSQHAIRHRDRSDLMLLDKFKYLAGNAGVGADVAMIHFPVAQLFYRCILVGDGSSEIRDRPPDDARGAVAAAQVRWSCGRRASLRVGSPPTLTVQSHRAKGPLRVISGCAGPSAARQVHLNKRTPTPRREHAYLASDPSSACRMTTCGLAQLAHSGALSKPLRGEPPTAERAVSAE